MFIILNDVDDGKIRINVSMIVYYLRVEDYEKEKECTEIKTVKGITWVTETPEEIDRLIEEALEQRVTNIDNLLGITYHNYQYGRD